MQNKQKVFRIFVEKRKEFSVESDDLLKDLRSDLRIHTLDKVRVLNRYDVSGITSSEYEMSKICVFSEPPVDIVYDESVDLQGACYVLAIESLPGQYDQRADSAALCVQILTCKEKPIVRTARMIVFYGELTPDQKKAVSKYLINPVDTREASMEKPDSLEDALDPPNDIMILTGFRRFSRAVLDQFRTDMGLAMSADDLQFTQKFFLSVQRDPTVTEIRVLDTYWSDHCRHTTFLTELTDVSFDKPDTEISSKMSSIYQDYLHIRENLYSDRLSSKPVCLMDIATMAMKKLKADGKLADLDESEEINACSIKVNIQVDDHPEEYVVMFKNETHNHPTEIEPFGGAATCLGGAIRDPLSGRSYVYQAMRVTGAGDPRGSLEDTLPGKLSQKKIVRSAAAGYSSYGNQIGLATGQVDEVYHPGYVAKRMEIGAVIGAAPASSIVRKCPVAGNLVILLGGRTGRDGIGGATGSSKAHDEKSVVTCGSEVQKGNPPTERKIQRLFRDPAVSKMILRCNDFGAGGVSVAIGELSDGLCIDLDAIPKKYEGLDGTELAISESQERMAVVIDASDKDLFLSYAAQENLEAVPVAVVTEEPSMVMKWKGQVIVDLPRSFINTNGAPSYAKAKVMMPDMNFPFFDTPTEGYLGNDFVVSLKGAISSLSTCSRKGLASRFDSTIGARTVLMPYGGKHQLSPEEGMVSKIPVLTGNTNAVSVMSYGFDPYLSAWSPFHGAYFAVAESLLKIAAMGADPTKSRLTFQEYFERMQSDESWGKPVAALLGAFQAQLDFQTPSIGGKDSMSGTYNDISVPPTLVSFAVATTTADRIVSSTLTSSGQKIYAITIRKETNGLFNKDHFLRACKAIKEVSKRGQLLACGVVKQGGIAARIAQMCFGNNIGFMFEDSIPMDFLFSKSYGVILASVRDSNAIEKLEMVGGKRMGHTTSSETMTWNGQLITLADAQRAFTSTLESVFKTKTNEAPLPEMDTTIQSTRKVPQFSGQVSFARPTVFIPVFPGTNCEYDSALAFEKAGANVDVLVIRNLTSSDISESLLEMKKRIDKANMIMIPGGFSGGDEPEGSGKFIATAFRNPYVTDAVRELLNNRDGLMIGICNGFQALIKLGLLPYGDILPLQEDGPTLTFNKIGRHQSGYVSTRIVSNLSPWLAHTTIGDVYEVPVSHGEGRFFGKDELISSLFAGGQVATQYVDLSKAATSDTYFNPNGSAYAIEGILSPDGRIFGKMCHSERIGDMIGKNIPGEKDQKIFASGVGYFK